MTSKCLHNPPELLCVVYLYLHCKTSYNIPKRRTKVEEDSRRSHGSYNADAGRKHQGWGQ